MCAIDRLYGCERVSDRIAALRWSQIIPAELLLEASDKELDASLPVDALLPLMMYTCNGARARPRRGKKHLLRASIKDGQHGRAWYLLLPEGCARLRL